MMVVMTTTMMHDDYDNNDDDEKLLTTTYNMTVAWILQDTGQGSYIAAFTKSIADHLVTSMKAEQPPLSAKLNKYNPHKGVVKQQYSQTFCLK